MQILTKLQEEMLKIFGSTQESNLFHLTGGTALAAFYLRHRLSKDLDFFTAEEEAIAEPKPKKKKKQSGSSRPQAGGTGLGP